MALKVDVLLQLLNIAESNKEIQKFAKGAQDSLAGIERSFKLIGAAALAVGGLVSFKEIIDKAIEGEAAVRQLNTALKLSGDFTEASSKNYQALASKIERVANISDETTLSLIAQSKAIGLTDKQTTTLANASVDLAAVLNTDISTAYEDLTKTLNGDVSRSLGNRFPELKSLSKEALVNGDAIKLLGARYSGAAAELNNNFGGAIKGIALGIGNIFENIGKIIVENPKIVASLFEVKDAIFKISEAFGRFSIDGGFFAGAISLIASGLSGFASLLNSVSTDQLVSSVRLAASSVVSFLVVFNAGKIVSFISSLVKTAFAFGEVERAAFLATLKVNLFKAAITFGLSILLDQLISSFTEFGNLTKALESKFAAIKGIIQNIASLFLKLVGALGKLEIGGGGLISPDTLKSIKELETGLDAAADKNKAFADSLKEGFKEGAKEQKKLLNNAPNKASDARELAQANEAALTKLKEKQQSAQIVSGAAQNPFQALQQDLPLKLAELKNSGKSQAEQDKLTKDTTIGAAIGGFAEVLKGPQGAASLISQSVGALANTVLPGIGGVVAQIAGVLAQGPEAVRGFVTGFINAIPTIVQNIILAIPVLIEALVNGIVELPQKLSDAALASLPEFIGSLVAQAPFIAIRLGIALQTQAPFIAISFAQSFIKDGIPAIVHGFVDEFKKQVSSLGGLLGGGGGGGVGGAIGKVGKLFGFASGGTPQFSGGDNVLAGFNAKELVIDRTDTQRLSQFLDQQLSNNNNVGVIEKKVDSLIAAKSSQGVVQPVIAQIQIGAAQFAQAMFEVRMDGHRV